tara:strand:+ start:1644 stop:1910 length:267 start_codon:yes stop_codon:yes gene_type:complete
MKKLITIIFAIGLLFPVVVEAGVSSEGVNRPRDHFPEGRPRKKRCKGSGGVVVCRMPKHRKPRRCGIMPCIPPGYYRPNPPRVIPMGF